MNPPAVSLLWACKTPLFVIYGTSCKTVYLRTVLFFACNQTDFLIVASTVKLRATCKLDGLSFSPIHQIRLFLDSLRGEPAAKYFIGDQVTLRT